MSSITVYGIPSCPHCIKLKEKIQPLINSRRIKYVDMKQVSQTSDEMKLFKKVSPQMHLPAMSKINGNNLYGYVGIEGILKGLSTI